MKSTFWNLIYAVGILAIFIGVLAAAIFAISLLTGNTEAHAGEIAQDDGITDYISSMPETVEPVSDLQLYLNEKSQRENLDLLVSEYARKWDAVRFR